MSPGWPTVPLPSSTLPQPVTPSLSDKLDEAARRIPGSKRGALDATVTLKGAEVSVGYRLSPVWTVGAWGGKEWHGGLDAGVRLSGSW